MKRFEKVLRESFPTLEISNVLSLHVGVTPEWDSMAHYGFLMTLEDEFNIRFSVEELSELKSVKNIVQAMTAKGISEDAL